MPHSALERAPADHIGLLRTEQDREFYITPADELTGLPICFAPKGDLAPVPGPRDRNMDRPADWNHMFPRFEVMQNPKLEYGRLGRLALLNLRAQWVDWRQHHDIYNETFVGPAQPETTAALARTSLFGLAGEVPEMALDLSGFSPKLIGLTLDQRRHLWQSGQVKVLSEGEVRRFLFAYVMEQNVDHIRRKELVEYLNEQDLGKRIYLAHCLAAKIVEHAVAPFQPDYVEFRQQSHRRDELPANPRDFLKPKLIVGARRSTRLVSILNKKLGAYKRAYQLDLPELAAA